MLIEVVLNQSLLNDYDKKPFWDDSEDGDKYSDLNNIEVPDYDEIQKYQLAKVRFFAERSLNSLKNKRKLESINTLFQTNINALISQEEKGEQMILSEVVTNIMNKFVEQKDLKKWDNSKIETRRQDYLRMQENFKELANELAFLREKLNIQSVVYDKDLDYLNNLIEKNSLKSFDQKIMTTWLNNLNSIKGEILEEIGTAWLNKVVPQIEGLQDYKGFSTGKLTLQGELSAGRHSGQLIQDLMLVDMQKVNLEKDISITYSIKGQSKTTSLGNFLEIMSNYSEAGQISITDDTYSTLLEMSSLNIQAKSGFNQMPWSDKASYNTISINDFLPETYNIPHILNLLQNLYKEETPTGEHWVKDNSVEYTMLTYYGLGSVLDKVLSLTGKEGNQYLLTPSGFISYGERMSQLFTKENKGIFKISGEISLSDDNILSQMRHVYSSAKFKA